MEATSSNDVDLAVELRLQVQEPALHSHNESETDAAPRMRFGRFFLLTCAQLAIALLIFYLAAPEVFRQEVRQPWAVAGLALLFGVPMSLFEYLYHRYLLHAAVLPFLRSMYRAHTQHHSLTSVKAPIDVREPERLVPVKSEYPVEHEHQEESMEFPVYSVSIFMAVFLVLLGLPTKLLFPESPAILALLIGVTLYYSAYELWHAVLHLPYERFWQPAMEHKMVGRAVRHTYSFHLMHHWRPTANLAIVGLWGFAIWDHIFRTHRRPERLPLQNAHVTYNDATLQSPRLPIRLLDRLQAKSHKWSRNVEQWLLQKVLRRKTGHPRP